MRFAQAKRPLHRVARRGVTLLEVLVALAILGLISVAWARLSIQSMHTVTTYHSRELDVQQAARELARLTLWSRDEFRRRIGRTRQGPFFLTVQEVGPSVYSVVLADTANAAPLLQTAFYAGDTISATR